MSLTNWSLDFSQGDVLAAMSGRVGNVEEGKVPFREKKIGEMRGG
jgi:hypothetical protein